MNIIIFGTEQFEREIITEKLKCSGIQQIRFEDTTLSMDNIDIVKGFEIVWIITNSIIGETEAAKLSEYGVRYIVTKSAGTDHLNKAALKKNNIHAANVPKYSPGAISEYTIMLLLASIRHVKKSINMAWRCDYTLEGLLGTEISNMTIGVAGYGKIGRRTVEILKGFGAEILVYTPHYKTFTDEHVCYAAFPEFLHKSDAIILNCPSNAQNYHMIDKEAIETMKDNVVIVNTARGNLIDHAALLEALEKGKVGSAALDVYEYEDDFIRTSGKKDTDEVFRKLKNREDVIYTSHLAFYSDEALGALRDITIRNVLEYVRSGTCSNEIT